MSSSNGGREGSLCIPDVCFMCLYMCLLHILYILVLFLCVCKFEKKEKEKKILKKSFIKKETLAQLFSCEFCERTRLVTTSVYRFFVPTTTALSLLRLLTKLVLHWNNCYFHWTDYTEICRPDKIQRKQTCLGE